MIKKLITYIIDKKIDLAVRRKLSKIRSNIKKTTRNPELEKSYQKLWGKLQKRSSLKFLYYYSAVNENYSPLYTPENLYYQKIEPVLNNKVFATAYADKNFYERFLPECLGIFPETFLRAINGQYFNQQYQPVLSLIEFLKNISTNTTYLLKPSIETSGGSNIEVLKRINDQLEFKNGLVTFTDFIGLLEKKYKGNFLLQKLMVANQWFNDFNPTSLNTVRLFTYRSVVNNKVHPLQAVVRFGKLGSIVDNQAAGGFSCGISAQGTLNSFAIDKYGKKYFFDVFKTKANTPVPGFDEMIKIAIDISSKYNYHRLLGFDFCVDNENKVRLLEINCKNIEINFLQMNNGPLFGDYTNEIISYCNENKKTVVLDFYV